MPAPLMKRKAGKTRSARVQPSQSACLRAAGAKRGSPSTLTSTIAAMVSPRMTSRLERRVRCFPRGAGCLGGGPPVPAASARAGARDGTARLRARVSDTRTDCPVGPDLIHVQAELARAGRGELRHSLTVGHVDVNGVGLALPDGRPLLRDISFRVGDGAKVALVGANGAGKTTLLKIVTGDLDPDEGSVTRSGGLGVMRQFVGSVRDRTSVRDLLLSVAPPRVREAGAALERAELLMMERDDEPTQLRYAQALADWADAGGYDAEVLWDTCTVAALGVP